MKAVAIRDKHIRLDQRKIERAKTILNAKTETEAIEKALELVIAGNAATIKRKEVMKSILARRDRLGIIKGDITEWISEGRRGRDKIYGG